jgi:hypothetical protein
MANSTVAHPRDELGARLLDHLGRNEVRLRARTAEELARINSAIEEKVAAFAAFYSAEVASGGEQARVFGRPAAELRGMVRRWEASGVLRYFFAGVVGPELGMTRDGDAFSFPS